LKPTELEVYLQVVKAHIMMTGLQNTLDWRKGCWEKDARRERLPSLCEKIEKAKQYAETLQ